MAHLCEICEKPLTFQTGAIAFKTWVEPALFTTGHLECLGDMLYTVTFPRLVADGLDGAKGWETHLHSKRWFTLDCEFALCDAHLVALQLQADEARTGPKRLVQPVVMPDRAQRSVAESIPRRRPRTPDNPRAISTGTRTRVLERDGFRCRRCGNGPDVAPLVIDHVVPVAKGGTAAFENLQTLCRPCNAGKSDREPTPHDMGAHA